MTVSENLPQENIGGSSFGENIVWLIKGFIFPLWSRKYYLNSTKKRLRGSILFLVLFGFFIAFLSSIGVAVSMSSVRDGIEAAYRDGTLPVITISEGRASVSPNQPFIYADARTIFGVDVSGQTTEIDTALYSQGFLLTETELHFVNEGDYQVVSLSDFTKSNDLIILDEDAVTGYWATLQAGLVLAVLFFGWFWNLTARFGYIALVALVVWGIVKMKRTDFSYKAILVTGIFANVPAYYILLIAKELEISFFSLFSIVLLGFWMFALQPQLKAYDTAKIESHPPAPMIDPTPLVEDAPTETPAPPTDNG